RPRPERPSGDRAQCRRGGGLHAGQRRPRLDHRAALSLGEQPLPVPFGRSGTCSTRRRQVLAIGSWSRTVAWFIPGAAVAFRRSLGEDLRWLSHVSCPGPPPHRDLLDPLAVSHSRRTDPAARKRGEVLAKLVPIVG